MLGLEVQRVVGIVPDGLGDHRRAVREFLQPVQLLLGGTVPAGATLISPAPLQPGTVLRGQWLGEVPSRLGQHQVQLLLGDIRGHLFHRRKVPGTSLPPGLGLSQCDLPGRPGVLGAGVPLLPQRELFGSQGLDGGLVLLGEELEGIPTPPTLGPLADVAVHVQLGLDVLQPGGDLLAALGGHLSLTCGHGLVGGLAGSRCLRELGLHRLRRQLWGRWLVPRARGHLEAGRCGCLGCGALSGKLLGGGQGELLGAAQLRRWRGQLGRRRTLSLRSQGLWGARWRCGWSQGFQGLSGSLQRLRGWLPQWRLEDQLLARGWGRADLLGARGRLVDGAARLLRCHIPQGRCLLETQTIQVGLVSLGELGCWYVWCGRSSPTGVQLQPTRIERAGDVGILPGLQRLLPNRLLGEHQARVRDLIASPHLLRRLVVGIEVQSSRRLTLGCPATPEQVQPCHGSEGGISGSRHRWSRHLR